MNKYTLPDLPYDKGDLAPVISEELLTLHHDKHHKGYVDGTNKALERMQQFSNGSSNESIKSISRDLSFNLNGHILHSLFWKNMLSPKEDSSPSTALEDTMSKNFGSFDTFKSLFLDAAKSVEGSGWAALQKTQEGTLVVQQIQNHNLLSIVNSTTLLVVDVWEHAYYLDYKNDRGEFLNQWWQIINWEVVQERMT